MTNQYTARALAILEHDAKYIPSLQVYHVNVLGTPLADECTYALRKKIEKRLAEG